MLDRPPSDYGRGAARSGWLLRSAASGLAALALTAGLAAALRSARTRRARASGFAAPPERAARLMRQGAAILAGSVFVDSALEHYRGKFHNPVMWVAPTVSAATLLHNVRASSRGAREPGGRLMPFAALLTGLVGGAFHVRNIAAHPGGLTGPHGLRWANVFYAAPLGAPVALSLAGAFGFAARSVMRAGRDERSRRGRMLAGLSSAALLGTTAEVWQLHFRGAFQNPFMYVPVSLPVVAALALALHAYAPRRAMYAGNRRLLLATALMGIAGVGFHAYGLQRNMGGLANFRQNILAGPPLPAPPAFSGVALAGLGALELMRSES
jgi:hypothetical protein